MFWSKRPTVTADGLLLCFCIDIRTVRPKRRLIKSFVGQILKNTVGKLIIVLKFHV